MLNQLKPNKKLNFFRNTSSKITLMNLILLF